MKREVKNQFLIAFFRVKGVMGVIIEVKTLHKALRDLLMSNKVV
jgi:hypothetical protein